MDKDDSETRKKPKEQMPSPSEAGMMDIFKGMEEPEKKGIRELRKGEQERS